MQGDEAASRQAMERRARHHAGRIRHAPGMISGDIIMGAEFLGGAVSNGMSAAAAWFGDDGSGGDGCGNDGGGDDGGGDGTGGDGGSGQGGGNTC